MIRCWRLMTIFSIALQAVIAAPVLGAQPPAPGVNATLDSARAVRGNTLRVSLVTLGPGDAIFERFGHNALVLEDTVTKQSFAYNWGMFDFNQPNFIPRFLSGNTRYWMAAFHTKELIASYEEDNRSVRIQQLALTPTERGALLDFVQWNGDGENAFYRYDYYRDNCSTRIRDALDRVLRGQLHKALDTAGDGRTWRSETRRLLAASIPAYAGIQVALGHRADRPLTQWEEAFLPEHLANGIAESSVTNESGMRVRLVQQDTVVFNASRAPMPTEPPSWLPMAALIGLTLAGLIAVLADSRRIVARVVLMVIVVAWYVVSGVVGTALLLAGTVTRHEVYMGANSTVLLANPLALVAMVLVPVALWRYQRTTAATGVASGIALLSLAALIMQLVPSLHQQSGEVIALMLPVQMALAFAVLRLDHRRDGAPVSRHS